MEGGANEPSYFSERSDASGTGFWGQADFFYALNALNCHASR